MKKLNKLSVTLAQMRQACALLIHAWGGVGGGGGFLYYRISPSTSMVATL